MKTPTRVNSLYLEATCVSSTIAEWDEFMKGSTKANVQTINRHVKEHLPELFRDLQFDTTAFKNLPWFNPYGYYKTKTHLILVHSGIEYFIRYE